MLRLTKWYKWNFIIRMHGNRNLSDSSSITISNGKTLEGSKWKFNTSSDNSNVNVNMQSYIFTGSETSWLLFDEYNFSGTSTCLGPSEVVQRNGFGATFSWNESLSIKSIRLKTWCSTMEPKIATSSLRPDPELTKEPDFSGGSNFPRVLKESTIGIVAAFGLVLLLINWSMY